MPQSSNRIFDELAKFMTDASSAAQGLRREVEHIVKGQSERLISGMDLVQREEFEAVKAMAQKAREESDRLEARIAKLEAEIERLRKA